MAILCGLDAGGIKTNYVLSDQTHELAKGGCLVTGGLGHQFALVINTIRSLQHMLTLED